MFWILLCQPTTNTPYRAIAVELDFDDRRNVPSFPRLGSPDSSPPDSNPPQHPTARQSGQNTSHRVHLQHLGHQYPAGNNTHVNICPSTPPIVTGTKHLIQPLQKSRPHSTAVPGSPQSHRNSIHNHTGSLPPTAVPPSNYAGSCQQQKRTTAAQQANQESTHVPPPKSRRNAPRMPCYPAQPSPLGGSAQKETVERIRAGQDMLGVRRFGAVIGSAARPGGSTTNGFQVCCRAR